MRPTDDAEVTIGEALAWQRDYVRGHGAPVAALVLDAVIDDIAEAGPVGSLLPTTVRFGDLPGLRVMATVHRLALARRAPEVAIALPTMGGTAPETPAAAERFRTAVLDVLAAHPTDLEEALVRPPQTNETGRAALLRRGLATEGMRAPSRPVRLWEIGASAGLNLRADRLPGDPAWEPGPLPAIVERRGCDRAPVDITTVDGRLLLSSFVWVDDVDRFRRLAAAFETAAAVPVDLVRMDAADFVHDLHPEPGHTTVLWHSAMWVYLEQATRDDVKTEIARAGADATEEAPLVHLSWEWDRAHGGADQFALVMRRWDGQDDGAPVLLARGMSHGGGVTVTDRPERLPEDPLMTA